MNFTVKDRKAGSAFKPHQHTPESKAEMRDRKLRAFFFRKVEKAGHHPWPLYFQKLEAFDLVDINP